MGIPFNHPPVFFTLCQVKFNQVLSLFKYLPEIQEAFRKADYPAFEQHQNLVINMLPASQIQGSEQPRYPTHTSIDSSHFGNTARTNSFVLDSHGLTLLSTRYGRFENYSAEFLKGLLIVHKALELSFSERIGLRYLNRVIPSPDDTIGQYLNQRVLGIMPDLSGTGVFSYSESVTKQGDVKLCARALIQMGGLVFPPDIPGTDLEIEPRFKDYNGVSALLDNDGSVELREAFSIESVKKRLEEIYSVTSTAFAATVTDHAVNLWGK